MLSSLKPSDHMPTGSSSGRTLESVPRSCKIRDWLLNSSRAMIGENRQLVTNEPVEVHKCRKITDRFRGFYRIYPNLIKGNRRMSTCNRLDLQTLGSQPVMPKILPDHWSRDHFGLHQRKRNVRVTMEFEVSIRHVWRLTL